MEKSSADRIKLLPAVVDNQYRGIKISQYAFLLITAATIVRSLIHVFAPDGGAQSIATIPLASYSAQAAATVILLFSLWGLSQLLMGFVYLGVYLKYKSLIPMMYVLLTVEYAMRIVIGQMKPIVTTGTAPGSVGSWIMVPVCVVLLALSLIKRKKEIETAQTLNQ
ncbi:MAG: hypothetical protein ABFC56_11275 [Clostridiaceae bacterium]